jgi:hypothetical protein
MIINRLKSTLSSLIFGEKDNVYAGSGLHKHPDSTGLILFTEPAVMKQLRLGQGHPTQLMQTIVLQMLQEQGAADELPNGYRLPSEVVASMDDDQADILQLPPVFHGSFNTRITGHTRKSSFDVQVDAVLDGEEYPFQRKGPYITLGGDNFYRLTPAELIALQALDNHQALSPERRNESENLRLMALLQVSARKSAPFFQPLTAAH